MKKKEIEKGDRIEDEEIIAVIMLHVSYVW